MYSNLTTNRFHRFCQTTRFQPSRRSNHYSNHKNRSEPFHNHRCSLKRSHEWRKKSLCSLTNNRTDDENLCSLKWQKTNDQSHELWPKKYIRTFRKSKFLDCCFRNSRQSLHSHRGKNSLWKKNKGWGIFSTNDKRGGLNCHYSWYELNSRSTQLCRIIRGPSYRKGWLIRGLRCFRKLKPTNWHDDLTDQLKSHRNNSNKGLVRHSSLYGVCVWLGFD